MATPIEIREAIKSNNVRFINLQFSDFVGQPKTVTVNADKIDDILDCGIWFDGSSIEGFARIQESDMLLKPDLETFAILPWSQKDRASARFICNIFLTTGEPLAADPRRILQNELGTVRKLGFTFFVGAEFEFYLLERSRLPELHPHDHKGYFDYTAQSRATSICENTMMALSAFNVQSEMHHHEVGRGQHEIDTKYSEALAAADNMLTIKLALKAYTSGTELKATWMPKPMTGKPGNGLHVHQSLWQGGTNVFYSPHSTHGNGNLSDTAMHFLAGQLKHARALSAVVSPSVNSYKRLVSGFEAPVYICWGQTNRSSLIRIPHSSPERANKAARIEYRAPDPLANSYLAFAALLAAGMDGVENKLEPPKQVEENVYEMDQNHLRRRHIETLPSDLREAIHALEADKVIAGIFGSGIKRYLEVKREEWRQFSYQVTSWEVDHYLN